MNADIVAFIGVAAFGALVGLTELLSRYKDDPARAVLSLPAAVYVGVNLLASVLALVLVRSFDWNFGVPESDPVRLQFTQALVAGLGASALFRSSLFNISTGDQTIGIGPNAILTVLTNAADRAVDRKRAIVRCMQIGELMKDVSFEQASEILPAYVWGAMQNTSEQDVKAVDAVVANLKGRNDIAANVKVAILGFTLLGVAGERLLRQIVKHLSASEQ